MLLGQTNIFEKLSALDATLDALGRREVEEVVPEIPGRDIEYLPISFCTGKLKISTQEGQQKLLHDLANIELQAMELGVRTLNEFPEAPFEMREELSQIVREEAKHLKMCLGTLERIGGFWGKWPVHMGLWHATHKKDTLLERLFIVHRYLEGSGLDAGDTILKRLSGIENKQVKQTVKVIVEEEVGHVAFGSKWYSLLAKELKIDDSIFFRRMCQKLMKRHPRKDRISRTLRLDAGFAASEIDHLEQLRLTR